ncbi:hypothetical protein NPJ88_004920 [Halomonas elongata]|uniref:hypothetical protein n=1 Tax=Halomonas elongata TaxID=2746 RepID=UPI00255B4071|nr:hypothetical protein [Halomonas elongata]MDL4861668.1 hypothetical protein [Halomonas elongata]
MKTVTASEVPGGSLLSLYIGGGAYIDCYSTTVSGSVSQAQYVEAFYTTLLFKLERAVLRVAFSSSTDAEAKELALGQASSFAIWRVENRREAELLLAAGRTRSWLMAGPATDQHRNSTRLHFGSAVVPKSNGRLGIEITALKSFYRVYSRALLLAARSRLENAESH